MRTNCQRRSPLSALSPKTRCLCVSATMTKTQLEGQNPMSVIQTHTHAPGVRVVVGLEDKLGRLNDIPSFPRGDEDRYNDEVVYRLDVFEGVARQCLGTDASLLAMQLQELQTAVAAVDLVTGTVPVLRENGDNGKRSKKEPSLWLYHWYPTYAEYFCQLKISSPNVEQLLSVRADSLDVEDRARLESYTMWCPAAMALRQAILKSRFLALIEQGVHVVANWTLGDMIDAVVFHVMRMDEDHVDGKALYELLMQDEYMRRTSVRRCRRPSWVFEVADHQRRDWFERPLPTRDRERNHSREISSVEGCQYPQRRGLASTFHTRDAHARAASRPQRCSSSTEKARERRGRDRQWRLRTASADHGYHIGPALLLDLLSEQATLASDVSMAAPSTPSHRYILFFDGGSRGNPGPGGSGAVIVSTDECAATARIVWSASTSHEATTTTNNQAEYQGVVAGLAAAERLTSL